MDPTLLFLILVATLFLMGALGEFIFQRTRIPDVIWLVAAGICLGPVFGVVPMRAIENLVPVFGVVALIVMLFQGGSSLVLGEVAAAAPRATLLGILGFGAVVGTVTLAGTIAASTGLLAMVDPALAKVWTPLHGVLLGAILGGSSSLVIMPSIQAAKVEGAAGRLVEMESTITDALCIVVTVAAMGFLTGSGQSALESPATPVVGVEVGSIAPTPSGNVNPSPGGADEENPPADDADSPSPPLPATATVPETPAVPTPPPPTSTVAGPSLASSLVDLAKQFGMALILGAMAAALWIPMLHILQGAQHAWTFTLAALFLLYVLVETSGGNPAMGILSFAIIVGNARNIAALLRIPVGAMHLELDTVTKAIHGQMAFIMKSFFFTFIGLSMPLAPAALCGGAVLGVLLLASRVPAVRLSVLGAGLRPDQVKLVTIAIPRGMAAGILASMPFAAGIEGTENLSGLVFAAVVTTILIFTFGFRAAARDSAVAQALNAAATQKGVAAAVVPVPVAPQAETP